LAAGRSAAFQACLNAPIVLDTHTPLAYKTEHINNLTARLPRSLAAFFRPEGLMNKQDLIAKIALDTGISKISAAAAVDSFFEGITKSLRKGQPITFVGFGTFKTAQRKARMARNPQTGAAIKIPKRRVVKFSAGKGLKTAVN
jgi:DNA-binding protein HU-beta